ncbi:hypothetical protein [Streptomyces hokutonensis]|uniref:hypothetical protein n=1 Tax=Streptomyces hokutonensis TaxID=1306990 RepID=UPI00340B3550
MSGPRRQCGDVRLEKPDVLTGRGNHLQGHYTLAFSTVRQTSHTFSVGVSLEWEIKKIMKIKVDGSYAYNVTKSTKKDNSVSFSLPVADHYYGYVQSKVQYHAITAYPIFASCQSKNETCTPKPGPALFQRAGPIVFTVTTARPPMNQYRGGG